ncbi:VOC family protein [Alkalihalobacillus pseudalcaliphilus]|uniref:VOC family protein n=1 Tax=Alkalihalobacillus pseudalcaliphilus TaxID=79884 RepID=UPI00064DA347|nr:VOC family protein [Alkalihalobacillus pseudalcaliphilus]KMK77737.1 3-demethylubiquinone-9 3-methyltransferase [Alkalihalobacillus pseudalcaliphilus]
MNTKIIPYLMFSGDAKAAMEFYQKVLGAEIIMEVTYGDMPDSPSQDEKDLIAHAHLKIDSSDIMISDSPSKFPVKQGDQVSICLSSHDVERSKQFFDGLKEGALIKMPFQETSFSKGYGSLVDRFGVTFLIDTAQE